MHHGNDTVVYVIALRKKSFVLFMTAISLLGIVVPSSVSASLFGDLER
jgi:hypothetical protein